MHWIPNTQLITETDTSNYALTAILSIVNKENKVHLVFFHSCALTTVKLNYNTYDKEFLAIFKAFKIWQHYLESLIFPINIVMDYKNLEYFSTTKMLIRDKYIGPSTSLSSTLSSGSALVISAPN